MKDILERLKTVLKELEQEYGEISLFALFLREEAFGKWDLLISASWLDSRALDSYEKVAKKVQKCLNETEIVQLARIVILDINDPGVVFLQDLYSVPNGSFVEVSNCGPLTERFGFVIKRAYVLRCVKGNSSALS
ncbi:MAG TPA: hypothetical protein VLG49_03765 [Rhabdochlamydiaceae bacterium]|nr:hypothetical protein [Rhabdochlamydiaceae bacterium]